ncbi:hypothetical protein BsWGS_02829 [Bradybaena similaris]
MTNERHHSLSNTSKRSEELPIMRRSRSLSELPGHLRVPILHRKDTERTKARLEAGAAGVKELRALREQQQELIDQAMATAQPKWRQQTAPRQVHPATDHHRIQQLCQSEHQRQQMNGSLSSPLSTWHSACSLASISEEWDQTLNMPTNKNNIRQMNDHSKTTQLRKAYHKQNEFMQSQDFSRGRSKSVHGDFLYFPDATESESEQFVSSPSSSLCRDNKLFQDHDLSRDVHIKDIRCRANTLDTYTHAHASIKTREQKDYPMLQRHCSLRATNQSMSWDNLLAVIGLQNENSTTTNESMEQDAEKCDDVFTRDNNVSQESNNYQACTDDEYLQAVQRKKMRSQSFTSGCSKYQDSNYRLLKTKGPLPGNQKRNVDASSTGNIIHENRQSEIVLRKQTSEKHNSVSLLRRASIQCEAVLTQTSTPRKIINPLQDVDINSLRSPGPLHAVTLQYSSMPMRELTTSSPNIASSRYSIPKEKATSSTHPIDSEVPSSPASTDASRRHNTEAVNAYNSVSIENSKQFTPENSKMTFSSESSLSEVMNTTSSKHPIPKPRTNIPKALSPQEATAQVNPCHQSNTSRKQNMSLEMLHKSILHENNSSNHIKTDRNNETESFTMTGINTAQEAEQHCSIQESDNRKMDTAAEYEREYCLPQRNLSVQTDCSSVANSTPDLKVDTDNRRNVSTKKSSSLTFTCQNPLNSDHIKFSQGRSDVQSNSAKKYNQSDCSKLVLPSKWQAFHTRDGSVLSDEGYSTCDSTSSPKSQLSSDGSLQSCDTSSLSCGSFTAINMSLINSPETQEAGVKKQCPTSTMESYVKHEGNCNKGSTKYSTRTTGLIGTNKTTRDKSHAYNEQCNSLEPKLCQSSCDKTTAIYHSQGKLAQQTDITDKSTSTKDGLKTCNNNIKNTIDLTVTKSEKCTVLTQSKKPIECLDMDTTKMFKQTSV